MGLTTAIRCVCCGADSILVTGTRFNYEVTLKPLDRKPKCKSISNCHDELGLSVVQVL